MTTKKGKGGFHFSHNYRLSDIFFIVQVIAIVTDRLTDSAIIGDLHNAASRGVPVYIILNQRSIQENFTLNRLRHPVSQLLQFSPHLQQPSSRLWINHRFYFANIKQINVLYNGFHSNKGNH